MPPHNSGLTKEFTSASTLLAPLPPAGFSTDISYHTSERLSPIGVYLCALDCMYYLTTIGWRRELDTALTISAMKFNVDIAVIPRLDPGAPLGLTTNCIVVGLWEIILDIATNSRFCEVVASLLLHNRQFGSLAIARTEQKIHGYNASSLAIIEKPSDSNAVTYPSGRYIDEDEQDFSVSYTFSGTRIDSKSIFLVVIDALAISAEFSPTRAFFSLQTVSPFGDCKISISGLRVPVGFNYSFITKALMMLVEDIMVALGKFEEITFQLEWQDETLAEGRVQLISHVAVA